MPTGFCAQLLYVTACLRLCSSSQQSINQSGLKQHLVEDFTAFAAAFGLAVHHQRQASTCNAGGTTAAPLTPPLTCRSLSQMSPGRTQSGRHVQAACCCQTAARRTACGPQLGSHSACAWRLQSCLVYGPATNGTQGHEGEIQSGSCAQLQNSRMRVRHKHLVVAATNWSGTSTSAAWCDAQAACMHLKRQMYICAGPRPPHPHIMCMQAHLDWHDQQVNVLLAQLLHHAAHIAARPGAASRVCVLGVVIAVPGVVHEGVTAVKVESISLLEKETCVACF